MKARPLIIAVSLGLGLLLGLAFRYQVTSLRREERRQTWLAYVRGPLKLYVSGSRGGAELLAELLKEGSLTPARRLALGDAVQDLRDAWTQAVAQEPDFQADAFFYDLNQAVAWHGAAGRLAENWPRLNPSNRDEWANARLGAEGIHRNMVLRVGEQWDRASKELPWSPQEQKECQDEVRELSQPLP